MSIYSPTGSFIHTAACLIIGDEILSSKTRDSNSQFFAKYCFDNGIDLKRIEVVPDEEPAIVDSTKRLSSAYDFVITSGGIGPTHDDITYLSIAKAFNLEVRRHAGTVERMKKLARGKDGEKIDWDAEDQQAVARNRLRMAEFPYSSKEGEVKVVWPHDDLWVPVVGVRNVHILPGVPSLFQKLLEGLKPMLKTDPGHKLRRIQIRTPLPESSVADLLRSVQESLDNAGKDVKIGSYPRWGKEWNTITVVGRVNEDVEGIAATIAEGTSGRIITSEEAEEERERREKEKKEKERQNRTIE